MTPEELGRGGAGRRADEADLVPAGEGQALGAQQHRRSLCQRSQTEAHDVIYTLHNHTTV